MRIIATKESEMKKMLSDDFHHLWSVFVVLIRDYVLEIKACFYISIYFLY